ncbi:unnamed protein product [Euphydryas editha]|uniref:Reverse transcriptase n=1 Tax=Euphydryas editha TaxID=104508 RepID=A0AAU9TM55_EUPED|nr:unnamed protein product [Euphydryas editha]
MDNEPPDPGGGYPTTTVPVDLNGSNRKRRPDVDINPQAKKSSSSALETPSIQLTYVHPDYDKGKNKYSSNDVAPFVVHVCRHEAGANTGAVLRPIQFGHFLHKNNIKNVVMDGIKRVGRNRVSIEFKTAEHANAFLDHSALPAGGYIAAIPVFSVSRMGIIREVPVEWSMEELVENIEVPNGVGKVVRARRLSRKSYNENNNPIWIPTQSVVLTFSGQKLPPRVFCFFTSLPVETYILPTIQCNNCCRFGHVKAQCRSKPRCFKCSQMHEGETCSVQSLSCLFCSGAHAANDNSCPEHSRQKAIKLVMSQESISYLEASARFPQETWLRPGTSFRLPGYVCLRDDRSDGKAGSAILVSRKCTYSFIPTSPHSDSLNVVVVRVLNVSFVSVYIPVPSSSVLSEFESILSSLTPPIVVLGDFNCHHMSWGSYFSDSLSLLLLDLFDEYNLVVLNDGSPTRRVSPLQNPKSAVDLSLSSCNISAQFSWSIFSDSFGSDHFPILISFTHTPSPSMINYPSRQTFKLANAEWSQFANITDQQIRQIPPVSVDNVHELYSDFKNVLLNSAKKTVPIKKRNFYRISSPPWWDSECTIACRRRKEAERLYSASMSLENYLNYKHIAAQVKRLLAQKKKNRWLEFCESLSPSSHPSLVWRNIKKFRGSFAPNDSPMTNDISLWLDSFSQKLAPPSAPSLEECRVFLSPPLTPLSEFDRPFSLEEFQLVLNSLKDSSPGVDGIPYSFVVRSGPDTQRTCLNFLNSIFQSEIPPEEWGTQIIVPILKPGKPGNDPSSYRPIALSSTLAKILEHLIKNRLEWIVENSDILSKTQFGFRKGRSTVDSLSIFISDIRIAFSKKESLVGVFLDMSSAYDNVLLPVLRQKMLHLSLPVKIVNYVCNYLSTRSIIVNYQNSTLPPRKVWKGLPQGSVLSPLLYNIYTNDLDLSVSSFCNVLQYADDVSLYISGMDILECSNRLNSSIYYLNEWLNRHGLSISTEKSSVVVFSRKRSIPNVIIASDNRVFPVRDNVKFLGVYLDSRMTGSQHINHVLNKSEKNVNILRSLSGVWWGSHPYTQKLLYNSLVRSYFDYGSFLLEPCNKTCLKMLDRVQSKSLRIIIGAMKSSPINAMQVECVDPPLHIRRQYLADRFIFKTLQDSQHPLIRKLSLLSQLTSSSNYWCHKDIPCLLKSYLKFTSLPCPVAQFRLNPLYATPFSSVVFSPKIILDLPINKDSMVANSQFNSIMNRQFKDWLLIYTDASKLSELDCVGVAVWIPKVNVILNYRLPPISSVFTGEVLAILEALRFVESHRLDKSIIITDSKSALLAITSNQFRSKSRFPLILEIKHVLFNLNNNKIQVELAWIPSHCGIVGNENVDLYAKEATRSGGLSQFKVYCQDIIPLAKIRLTSVWNELWMQSSRTTGKHYADIQRQIPIKPWFFKYYKAPKYVCSTICRLRLGHSCNPVFLAKIRIRDSSLCECGLDEGSPEHIFFSCSQNVSSLYNFLPPVIPRPTDFKSVLSFVHTPFVDTLCAFIVENNIRL